MTFWKKTYLLLLGLILVFFILEFFLQTFSLLTKKTLARTKITHNYKNNDQVLIFCFGDSFTFGLGAPQGKDYPTQLQEILNANNLNKSFKVVNFGICGSTTTDIMQNFKHQIEANQPDFVIITAGCNDRWAFYDQAWKISWACDLLHRLKTYKLLSILRYNLQQKKEILSKQRTDIKHLPTDKTALLNEYILQANILRDKGKFKQAELLYLKTQEIIGKNYAGDLELGRCYKLNKEYDLALDLFAALLYKYPDNNELYSEVKDLFTRQDQPLKTIKFCEKFINHFNDNYLIKEILADAYITLGGNYLIQGKADIALSYYIKSFLIAEHYDRAYSKLMSICTLHPKLYRKALQQLSKKENLRKMIKKGNLFSNLLPVKFAGNTLSMINMIKIAQISQAKNITVIFSGYPQYTPPAIKQVSHLFKIPIVMQEDKFNDLLKNSDHSQYFSDKYKMHCNENGYKVMAENISTEILKLLPSK